MYWLIYSLYITHDGYADQDNPYIKLLRLFKDFPVIHDVMAQDDIKNLQSLP